MDTGTERHSEKCHVTMEAEIEFMLPQSRNAKDHQQPPDARTKQRSVLPWNLQREHGPKNTLISVSEAPDP